MLSALRPEYQWIPWMFNHVSMTHWTDKKNHKIFLDWAGKNLGVKQYEDWYKIMTKVEISMNFLIFF